MQRKKRVRLISRLLMCVLCLTICVPAVPVKADNDDAELKAAIEAVVGKASSPEQEEARLSFVAGLVSSLKTCGLSDAATAGALASIIGESSFNPFMVEGGSSDGWAAYDAWVSGASDYDYKASATSNKSNNGGIGVVQWTYGRHKEFCDFSKNNSSKYGGILLHHYWVESRDKNGNVVTDHQESEGSFCGGPYAQTAFIAQEVSSGKQWITTVKGVWQTGAVSLDEFKALSGTTSAEGVAAAEKACIAWTVCYERCKGSYNSGLSRATRAAGCYNIVTNSDMASGDSARYDGTGGSGSYTPPASSYNLSKYINIEQAEALAIDLSSAGYWSEDDLAEYCRLTELNVDSILAEAKRENLNQREIEGLSQWELNVNDDLEKNGLASIIRRIVVFVGIIFLVWVVFVYLAYWFDRINTMFYIDLLGIMTLGHLHISDTEEECTFHAKDLGNGQRKTVNHRTILFICLAGIAFGVLIITGTYYSILRKLVNFIKRVIGTFM